MMSRAFKKGRILVGFVMVALMAIPVSAGANAQKLLCDILIRLQSRGEYVLGSFYQEDKDKGTAQIMVETTEGTKRFDESGALQESKDREGNRTIYKNGIPVKTVTASGKEISSTQVEKKATHTWLTNRDYYGNLQRQKLNAQGEMEEMIDQQGISFRYQHHKDAQGRSIGMTQINQLDGTRVTRFFNPNTGDVDRMINPQGAMILIKYVKDGKGRKLESFEQNTRTGLVTQKKYDENGREVMVIDPSGKKHAYEYKTDAHGHVIASTETTTKKDSSGQTITYKLTKNFDGAGRVVSEKDSLGKEIHYKYTLDDQGRAVKIEENETIAMKNGRILRRQRTKIMGDDGRLKTLIDEHHRKEYQYEVDEQGRVKSVTELKYIRGTGKSESNDEENPLAGRVRQLFGQGVGGPRSNGGAGRIQASSLGTTNFAPNGNMTKRKTQDENGTRTVVCNQAGEPQASLSFNPQGKPRYAAVDSQGQERVSLDFSGPEMEVGFHEYGEDGTRQTSRTYTPSEQRQIQYGEGGRKQNEVINRAKGPAFYEEANYEYNEEGNLTGALRMDNQGYTRETMGPDGKPQSGVRENYTGGGPSYLGFGSKGGMQYRSESQLAGATQTIFDENGKPVFIQKQDRVGPMAGREKDVEHVYDANGNLMTTHEVSNLGDSLNLHGEDGQVVESDKTEKYGPELGKVTLNSYRYNPMGSLEQSEAENGLSKRVNMHGPNGELASSQETNFYGPEDGRERQLQYSTDPDTGQITSSTAVDGLHEGPSVTLFDPVMGSPTKSLERSLHGATAGKDKTTYFDCNLETGKPQRTLTTDGLQAVLAGKDEDGLTVNQETWKTFGPTAASHARAKVQSSRRTGLPESTDSSNDLGDKTITTMDSNGLAERNEVWKALGPTQKRHTMTDMENDPGSGMPVSSRSVDDLGDETETQMDENGLPVSSETTNALGARMKRHSLNVITSDLTTGSTAATTSVNDLGDRTTTLMDEHGLPVASESQNALGPLLKRENCSAIDTDPGSGMPRSTVNVNALGDKSLTSMDKNGLAVETEAWNALGPELKKHSVSINRNDEGTGMSRETASVNDLGDVTKTQMDKDGLPVANESWNALGPKLKQHSATKMTTDGDTAITRQTDTVDDLGDRTVTDMNENGMAVSSESWNQLGARLKLHTQNSITTDPRTGATRQTDGTNDLGDRTLTKMDGNGMPVGSEAWNKLGATQKRHSDNVIATNPATGQPQLNLSQNDLGDRSLTQMDMHGLPVNSESWNKLGPELKKHSASIMTPNYDTGIGTAVETKDDLGDWSKTKMDKNGLAVSSQSNNRLGAVGKRKNITGIKTDGDTGMPKSTVSANMLKDKTITRMDENGLAVSSETWSTLGATFKRHTRNTIITDPGSGVTKETHTVNDLGDRTITWMNEDGLAVKSETWNKLGARLKLHSINKIDTDPRTGLPVSTASVNDLGDTTSTQMDENGLPVSSINHSQLGPTRKQDSISAISTNAYTGLPESNMTVNKLGDKTLTQMNEHGLAVATETWNALGAEFKRHSLAEVFSDPDTGVVRKSDSLNDMGDRTLTSMDGNGLAVRSETWLTGGPELKRHSIAKLTTDGDNGVTKKSESVNDLGDETVTEMDDNSLVTRIEQTNKLGARLKRHSVTRDGESGTDSKGGNGGVQCDPETGMTKYTRFVNDLGDVSQTWNDDNGLPTQIVQDNTLGANLKKHSISTAMGVNQQTGVTEYTCFINDLGDISQTWNDKDGMPTQIDQLNKLGAIKKRHSETTGIDVNHKTGITEYTKFVNDMDDETQTWNDINGLPTIIDQLNSKGAIDTRHSRTQVMRVNQDTGVTQYTNFKNDLGDVTQTWNNGDGLPVQIDQVKTLGANFKKHSKTKNMTVNPDNGNTEYTHFVNDLGDHTQTWNDDNGLPTHIDQLNALGAELTKHSWTTGLTVNQETGITEYSRFKNELEDVTQTWNDDNGLPTKIDQMKALGPELKKHSTTDPVQTTGPALKAKPRIEVDQHSGITQYSCFVNDLGDISQTWNDKDGLPTDIEQDNVLGAELAKHSKTQELEVDRDTGITKRSKFINDMEDTTETWNDVDGLPTDIEQIKTHGAIDKRYSRSLSLNVNHDTGMTEGTVFRNKLDDISTTENDRDGMPTFIKQKNTLGAGGKLNSWTTDLGIEVDRQTGVTTYTEFENTLGDVTQSWNDADGLPTHSHTKDKLGVPAGLEKWTIIHPRRSTGMTELTETYDALHIGPTVTKLDDDGLAYESSFEDRYGPSEGAKKRSEIFSDPRTGITRKTHTHDGLKREPSVTFMNENGLAYHTNSYDRYGATAGQDKSTSIYTDPFTGITRATYTKDDLHEIPTETRMDFNGMAYFSHSLEIYGAEMGREKWTSITTRNTGTTAKTLTKDGLHEGLVETLMNDHGLATQSKGRDRFGAERGKDKFTRIYTRGDIGTTEKTITYDDLHTRKGITTLMDQDGLAYRSEGTELLGPRYGQHKLTFITPRRDIGTTEKTRTYDGMHDGPVVTNMDRNGLATSSQGKDRYGVYDGREKHSTIHARLENGTTRQTITYDKLHTIEGVTTDFDIDGMANHSVGTETRGPFDGRKKTSTLVPNRETGLTASSSTEDGLHEEPTRTIMDINGFAVESWAKSKYGPPNGRCQHSLLTADPDTGITIESRSETLSSFEKDPVTGMNPVVISITTTINDIVFGTPVAAFAESTFGAFKRKRTDFTEVDKGTGQIMRSLVTDEGGSAENEHNEFGVTKSTRYNLLGAIKVVVTLNDVINEKTGMVISSLSTDRKGNMRSNFNINGLMTDSTRINTGATYSAKETSKTTTWNSYTGSPLESTSQSYASNGTFRGKTKKKFDLDGFLEYTRFEDRWGDVSETWYTNNRDTGLPTYSWGTSESGKSETWYEGNGLALSAKFTATIGLHSNTEYYYYADNLDLASTKSVDERGNISVSIYNMYGEITESYSKSGTSHYDLLNNRVSHSEGPGGSTTYSYAGKYMFTTENTDPEGEKTTSWYDQRINGAVNKVQSKDGTITYGNTYNKRGFVTYRTESDGKEHGYSTFNDYGDQLFTHWDGTMPPQEYPESRARFLGGSWSSETKYYYKQPNRGDVDHWDTVSTWSGMMEYDEIGHWRKIYKWIQVTPEDGYWKFERDEYVVDRPYQKKAVGDTTYKTDSPKWAPLDDQWIISHVRGTQDLSVSKNEPWKNQDIDNVRDATRPEYHSLQKGVIITDMERSIAEDLREQYQPLVEDMEAKLKEFAKTMDLSILESLAGYIFTDKDEFRKNMRNSGQTAKYLLQAVDAAYYYFSAQHLTTSQLTLDQVQQALTLVNTPTDINGLLKWMYFTASFEEREEIGKKIQAAHAAAEAEADPQTKALIYNQLWTDLANGLNTMAQKNLGVNLAIAPLKQWLAESLKNSDVVNAVVTALTTKPGTGQVAASAKGVSFGTAMAAPAAGSGKTTVDEDKISETDVTAASAANALLKNEAPVSAKKSEGDRIGLRSAKKNLAELAVKNPIRALPSLRLDDVQAEAGEKTLDKKGRVVLNQKPDQSKTAFEYTQPGDVLVKQLDAQGKVQCEYVYEDGWMTKAKLPKGAKLSVSITLENNGKAKAIDIVVDKAGEKKVFKYDGKQRLQGVFVQDGNRLQKVENEEVEQEELDTMINVLEEMDGVKGDKRLQQDKIEEKPGVKPSF